MVIDFIFFLFLVNWLLILLFHVSYTSDKSYFVVEITIFMQKLRFCMNLVRVMMAIPTVESTIWFTHRNEYLDPCAAFSTVYYEFLREICPSLRCKAIFMVLVSSVKNSNADIPIPSSFLSYIAFTFAVNLHLVEASPHTHSGLIT